jgi:hypothetical protein
LVLKSSIETTRINKTMKKTKFEKDLVNDVLSSNSLMLSQIAGEVEEFCEHPDCTTLQAVQLMKCKLKEYEIRDIRNQIYKTWKE